MHQSEVPTAGIGLFPGEGGFKQDGAAVQEIIARRVILIDPNAYVFKRCHSQDGTIPRQSAVFHLQAQELLREYFRGRSSFQRQPGNSISSMRPQLSPQFPSIFSLDRYGTRHLPSIACYVFRLTSFPLSSAGLIVDVASISNKRSIVKSSKDLTYSLQAVVKAQSATFSKTSGQPKTPHSAF